MGEVYRADDLTLDHPVALKFLPEAVAASPDALTQFHNELRTARQQGRGVLQTLKQLLINSWAGKEPGTLLV